MRQRRIESFLVRIIIEEHQNTCTNEWRGRMQHVGSGIEHQFDTLDILMQLIRAQLAIDLAALPVATETTSRITTPDATETTSRIATPE